MADARARRRVVCAVRNADTTNPNHQPKKRNCIRLSVLGGAVPLCSVIKVLQVSSMLADESEAVIGELALLKEVVNGDYMAMGDLLRQHAKVNVLGLAGESPLHIAIYKKDSVMINMLLDAQADVTFCNKDGDSPLHLCARLGHYPLLQLLYERAPQWAKDGLFLEEQNNVNMTALDVALTPVQDIELDMCRLYLSWTDDGINTLDSEREPLRKGRALCASFLREKMKLDRDNKTLKCSRVLIDTQHEHRKLCSILQGRASGHHSERVYYSHFDVPAKLDVGAWNEKDKAYFDAQEKGVEEVATGRLARDFVVRVLSLRTMDR